MSQANFLFYGAPADVAGLLAIAFTDGLTCLNPDVTNGRFSYYDEWGSALQKRLETGRTVFLAGDFSVDVRPLSVAAETLVDEKSGPVLFFRAPSVAGRAVPLGRGRDYGGENRQRPTAEDFGLMSGLLHIEPWFSLKGPHDPERQYDKEARSAFRRLMAKFKRTLVQHEGRWVTKTVQEWALSGPLHFL